MARDRTTIAQESKTLAALSIPVIITQLGTMLLGVVDVLMVGHAGTNALGAASLGNLWVMGTFIFAMGVILGMDPIVTQAHGRRDPEMLGRALQWASVLSVILSVPLALVWLLAREALERMGQTPELSELAGRYVLVQVPSIPAFLGFTVLRQYLQGRGIVAPAMWIAILANPLNAGMNWVLIYGHFGFPVLGVTGAGIATSVTRVFMFLALLALALRLRLHDGGWVPWSRESFRPRGLLEIVRFGFPTGLQIGLEVWAFQAATLLAGRLGEIPMAAHTIVLNMASFTFMVPLGISLGAVTRVGNLLGERRPRAAQTAAWVAVGMGAAFMMISALFLISLRWILPDLYTSHEETARAAAQLLPIAGAFQLFDGIQVVTCGILRGMGRTRPAAFFNVVGYYVLGLPLGWTLAFTLQRGLPGLWWGLCAGLATVAVLGLLWLALRGPASTRRFFVG